MLILFFLLYQKTDSVFIDHFHYVADIALQSYADFLYNLCVYILILSELCNG